MKREEFSLARGFVAFGVAVALVCDAVSGWNQRQFLREEAAPVNAAPEQGSGQLEEPLLVLVNGENAVPESWWFLPYLVDDEVVDRRMAEDLSALLEAAESQGCGCGWPRATAAAGGRRTFWKAPSRSAWPRGSPGTGPGEGFGDHRPAGPQRARNRPRFGFQRREPGLPRDRGLPVAAAARAAYGFIQRYQREKEDVTGIKAEPWHFRYVGREHALAMERLGLCLEEYVRWQRALGGP